MTYTHQWIVSILIKRKNFLENWKKTIKLIANDLLLKY